MPPAISVVMRVRNGERFLREALDSVLDQSFSDFELIVVDDGSTDASPRILADYAPGDPRILVDRQASQGAAAAANRGFALAGAPLVAILDHDDVAMPDWLEHQRRFLTEHEETAVVGGGVRFMDESGAPFADVQYPLTDAEIREAFSYTTPVAQPGVMLRKEAFEWVRGYRSKFEPAADLDFWLRIAEHYRLANRPEIVVNYRMHTRQMTVQKIEQQALCVVAARVAARARAAGLPEPFDDVRSIDEPSLVKGGASREEVTAAFVKLATWLAKTMDRAGYTDAADGLFADADARARSDFGSRALVASVHRARAQRLAERGSRLHGKLETIRAVMADLSS